MSLQTLFQRQSAVVRDTELVLVKREVQVDGTVCYLKQFKPAGFDVWASRENRFFNLFAFKNLKHVVRPRKTEYTEQGVAEVATLDAGLSIEEWLQVGALRQNGRIDADVFMSGEELLRLARWCLQALQEIHAVGVIHCDIKPDNVCLPYRPKPMPSDLAQNIQIAFEQIRLIDFSFSLSAEIPLQEAVLPINSQAATAEYFAPAFRAAVLADQTTQRPQQVNQLDYRVDLYSLAYMLEKLLDRTGMVWAQPGGAALLRQLLQDWKTLKPSASLPHAQWIAQLDTWLAQQPAADFRVVEVTPAQTTTQYHTPVTPLLVTPIALPVPGLSAPATAKKSGWKWALAASVVVLAGGAAWLLTANQPHPASTSVQKITAAPIAEVVSKPVLPDVQNMDGKTAAEVQALQQQTADALDLPVSGKPCEHCPTEVVIPAGAYSMGSLVGEDNARPLHTVTIAHPFMVSKYEITRAEFSTFVAATGYDAESACFRSVNGGNLQQEGDWRNPGFEQTDHHPVVCVNWADATAYVQWLSKSTGLHYRLLTESEWEYACRGGSAQQYCGGDELHALAWFSDNSNAESHAVGQKQANVFGLHDMTGNAWEWVEDVYHDNYQQAPEDGSARGGSSEQYVLRGGAWASEFDLEATSRHSHAMSVRNYGYGFRVAREVR